MNVAVIGRGTSAIINVLVLLKNNHKVKVLFNKENIGVGGSTKKGINYLPVAGGARRIKSNVIFALNSYWCDSYDINNSGKCRSNGWVNGSER